MKTRTMLSDVLRSLFRRPATVGYPAQRQPAPERLRGKLHWRPEQCIGCGLCVKDCPCRAIEIITLDKASKRFALRYDAGRCTFCAQCVQNCRFNCLELSHDEWELAAVSRDAFTICYGCDADPQPLLARCAEANADAG